MSLRNGHARWAFDLSTWRPSLNELLLATSCIQTEEKTRLAKFMFREDFDGSIIGRLLMRKFVRDTINIPYEEIRFDRDARGKPLLAPSQHHPSSHYVDFNVSHQGSYAVLAGCCLSSDHRKSQELSTTIGVDVMKIEYTGGKPLSEFFRIMHRNFTASEWKCIRNNSDELGQTKAFMRHWCLKESYVKNVGVGISMDLQKIDFTLNTKTLSSNQVVTDTTVKVNGDLLENWIFEESLIDNEHSVAVAIENHNDSKDSHTFQLVTFDDLTRDSVPLLDNDRQYCLDVLNKPYKNS
ncbi:L-aminoadipate-semialdehyde dehydrogenase-phosphopantetheinyl transferase [Bradysia coprophila]|uniref:L-aminoadipate-semialdehyde dehydrogenase-phosphopantetheinyl transferase n=1 Tax=Bradysia coprophila TaxID=38358 RepID=UPI00187DB615|nr:L-aminoadipate-semialdehyde dehydrogenase-phosphopantetheinyl transferase [Bradysia coprophila]